MRVAIVGAGLAGLTAARALRKAGLSVVVYDKGRGVGGRISTRRADGGLQFDHGAQYLSAEDAGFAAVLSEARAAGAAGTWAFGLADDVTVGTPGMSAIAKYLATAIDVRQGMEIPSVTCDGGRYRVAGEDYDRVITTVPAPQAISLIGASHPLAGALASVVMEPSLTLMLALPASARGFEALRQPDEDIAWIALDSAKQARPGPDCWVAQAGRQWSRTHLDLKKSEIAQAMLPTVCKLLGADASEALYVAGHRWRYAQASSPLGQPFLAHEGSLFMGGDWALSDRAEGAWQSGSAMAQALLETR
ncbi:MAG: FAD-dependent oxidoreductase [Pseudomonadota bacterium]